MTLSVLFALDPVAPNATEPSTFDTLLRAFTPLVPVPALLAILPIVVLFFRKTWRRLDEEAQEHRGHLLAIGKIDYRPLVALVVCAVVLTMQEYYGGRMYFEAQIKPHLIKYELAHPERLHLFKFDELYGFGWWAFTRVLGYVVIPFPVYKLFFRKDSLLDMGLRVRGFWSHAWIYALFIVIVVPAMLVVSRQPDFGAYYPFYKNASRSWFDFVAWEAMYFAQFFALEMFFRGFWLGALRKTIGSAAIFAMAVPYCMIHYGKPYLEAMGAIVAGIALGSLSMLTRSIYQGFLVHITVALLMDWLALRHRHATPFWLWPHDGEVAAPEQIERIATRVDWGLRIAIASFVVVALVPAALRYLRARRGAAAIDTAPS